MLQVINRSTGDLQPVFNTVVEKATRLCDAEVGVITSLEADGLSRGCDLFHEPPDLRSFVSGRLLPVIRGTITGRTRAVGASCPYRGYRIGPRIYPSGGDDSRKGANLT